ncbi:MAG: hypothetical protein L0Y75_10625 [Acidobacteria bacterium]|nr:hypothetical protein [Acidobacteriota bacterium]
MLDMKRWREKWAMIEEEEDRLAREMTVEESVRIYLSLCHSLAPMIEETKYFFLPDREAYLDDWRERMHKLTCWLQKQNGTPTESA